MPSKIISSSNEVDIESLKRYIRLFIYNDIKDYANKYPYDIKSLDGSNLIYFRIKFSRIEEVPFNLISLCSKVIEDKGPLPDSILYDEVLDKIILSLKNFYSQKELEQEYLNVVRHDTSTGTVKICYPTISTDYFSGDSIIINNNVAEVAAPLNLISTKYDYNKDMFSATTYLIDDLVDETITNMSAKLGTDD